jgi:autotransporter-associated beta strand protein
MQGGELVVGNGYRLAIAVDGRGVLHQTGGEVFATEVVVNARSGGGGHGRLTLEGGVLNVGSNGVTAGNGAPYLIEYGGGTVRAVTNFASSLNATLTAAGVAATVFDTREWGITLSGNLTGAGGLSKAGTGTLTLSGANSYEGPTRVMQGRLVRAAWNALPAGNEVQFGVTPDDAGGRIHADGDLSLEGLVAGVADPEMLDKGKVYTVATWGGALVAGFDGENLPAPWYVHIDWPNKRAQLRDDIGTVIWLR